MDLADRARRQAAAVQAEVEVVELGDGQLRQLDLAQCRADLAVDDAAVLGRRADRQATPLLFPPLLEEEAEGRLGPVRPAVGGIGNEPGKLLLRFPLRAPEADAELAPVARHGIPGQRGPELPHPRRTLSHTAARNGFSG